MDISSLSKQLNISLVELRRRMREAGFKVSPRARKIDNHLARQILQTFAPPKSPEAAPPGVKTSVKLPAVLAVRDLAGLLGVPVTTVIKVLIHNGVMASLNEQIDFDAAAIVASELGFDVQEERTPAAHLWTVPEVIAAEPESARVPRPPIVAVMGHVDHGKTKLLDTIRSTNVAATEAGAITQHIGAYTVRYQDKTVTFLDTPGHEAFAAMRARGANVTDLIVLVVAADDGVKQQTLEVINRAKMTKTPMIVAINKIDKADARPEQVKSQLAEAGVVPEEWGGKTIFVPISAKQNIGVDKLLDTILLTAEMEQYRANPAGTTVGTMIESHLSKTKGPIASVIIQNGTLVVGDWVSIGAGYGKVRTLEDDHGKSVKSAGPSMPVIVSGLNVVPEVGDLLRVHADIQTAQLAAKKMMLVRTAKRLAYKTGIAADVENQQLNLILKADVQGSLEAIAQELHQMQNEDVRIKVVFQGVGEITESDVLAAESSRATIIGFHTSALSSAVRLAKQKGVHIDLYEVIYELTEDITQAVLRLILPEVEEIIVGRAKILALFRVERGQMIVGGAVVEGLMMVDRKARIVRAEQPIGEGKIVELQRNKQPVKTVPAGSEFGMKISTNVKIEKGDTVLIIEERLREKKLKRLSEHGS